MFGATLPLTQAHARDRNRNQDLEQGARLRSRLRDGSFPTGRHHCFRPIRVTVAPLKLSFQSYLELGGTPRLLGASRFRAAVLPPL
jgi:hypothetical protein